MKKALVVFGVMIIMLSAVALTGCGKTDSAKVVGDYDGNVFSGYENIISDSSAFDLGVNKYGKPIFVDRDSAYKTMESKCKDGITALKEQFPSLSKFSVESMTAYGNYAMDLDVSKISKSVQNQANFIAAFADIYFNSDQDY
jgi:hypothetical protein